MDKDEKDFQMGFSGQLTDVESRGKQRTIQSRQEVQSSMERRFMSDRATNIAGAGKFGAFPMFKTGGIYRLTTVGA